MIDLMENKVLGPAILKGEATVILSLIEPNQPDELETLLVRVKGMQKRRKLHASVWPIVLLVAFLTMMCFLMATTYLQNLWAMFAALLLTCGIPAWIWIAAERRELRTLEALTNYRDVRSLGFLLESAECYNRKVRVKIHATILDSLPNLTEDDSKAFSLPQLEALNALLYGKSGELAMASFAAIEKVGSISAMPYLTSIAAGKGIPDTLKANKTEVQERAQRTVQAIQARIERKNSVSFLLRGSQAPETATNQLLRPAHGQHPINTDELLRPDETSTRMPDKKEELQ